jgi:hypothetical protein
MQKSLSPVIDQYLKDTVAPNSETPKETQERASRIRENYAKLYKGIDEAVKPVDLNIKTIANNYVVTSLDDTLLIDTSGNNVTLTLQPLVDRFELIKTKSLTIKKVSPNNSVIINSVNNDLIIGTTSTNNVSSITLKNLSSIDLFTDGKKYFIK